MRSRPGWRTCLRSQYIPRNKFSSMLSLRPPGRACSTSRPPWRFIRTSAISPARRFGEIISVAALARAPRPPVSHETVSNRTRSRSSRSPRSRSRSRPCPCPCPCPCSCSLPAHAFLFNTWEGEGRTNSDLLRSTPARAGGFPKARGSLRRIDGR